MTQVQIRSNHTDWNSQGATGLSVATAPLSDPIMKTSKDQSGSVPSENYYGYMFEGAGQLQDLVRERNSYWVSGNIAMKETGNVVLTAELGSQLDEALVYHDFDHFETLTNFINKFLGKIVNQPIEYKSATFEDFEDLLYDF